MMLFSRNSRLTQTHQEWRWEQQDFMAENAAQRAHAFEFGATQRSEC
jgi:hypothetical protein